MQFLLLATYSVVLDPLHGWSMR